MITNKPYIHAKAADMESAGLSMSPTQQLPGSHIARSPISEAISKSLSKALSQRFLLPLLSCSIPGLVFAAPEGAHVVAGSATITNPDANSTLITQTTSSAAINWQRFNIGTQEYVQFAQPDANSVALNRVVGGDPSSILGNLSANGQVFLVNPNGVYFGHTATVDVGGIVASVHDIRNEDFMAGNYVFSKGDGAPEDVGVVNDGLITARDGGYVVLMGDYAHNNGVINARMGTVALAAGNHITMDVKGNGLVSVAIDEETFSDVAGVDNTGDIVAAGGRVIMSARVASDLIDTAINNEGLVVANGIAERNGAIFLTAAGGDVVNSGTLDASAADGSNVDGGGVIVYSDKDVTITSGAEIKAAADGEADGGVVRVIAENHMDFQSGARIDVTADADASSKGDGGFVEVSGHGSLAIRGDVDIGTGGQLLIDPASLTITNSNNSPSGTTGGSSPSFSNGFVGKAYIEGQLNSNTGVTLVADNNINSAAGTLGGSTFTINATGTGNLDIISGRVTSAATGSLGFCSFTGVCLAGTGSNGVIQNATGNINLGKVSFDITGGLNVAGGTASGNVSLGGITAGGDVSIVTGGDLDLTGTAINAGGNVLIDADIGTSAARRTTNLTVNADGNIDINSNIFIANNSLELHADKDNSGVGAVNIKGTYGQTTTVSTLGNLNVRGQDFNVSGATASGSFTATDSRLSVEANNVDVSIAGDMVVFGGKFVNGSSAAGTADVSASVTATNNITIDANRLIVRGGTAEADFSGDGTTSKIQVLARAELTAGADISITAASNFSASGGVAIADATNALVADADAGAIIHATNNLSVSAGHGFRVHGGTANAVGDAFIGGFGTNDSASGTARANADLSAGNQVSIINTATTTINIDGGIAGASAGGTGFCTSTCSGIVNSVMNASANASITGPVISIDQAGVVVRGGQASALASGGSFAATGTIGTGTAFAFADATAVADAVISGGTVTISNDTGAISASGGGAFANVSDVSLDRAKAAAVSLIESTSGELKIDTSDAINIRGGMAITNVSGSEAIADAYTELASATHVKVTAGSVNVSGGTATSTGSPTSATPSQQGFASAKAKVSAGDALSIIATNDITNVAIGNGGDFYGNGIYMSAGNNIDLVNSTVSVGTGTVSGIEGDKLTLAYMALNGIKPPTTLDPNAKFSAGGVLNLGNITMSGDVPYLWLEADTTNLSGLVEAPGSSDIVVQFSPYTLTASIGVEAQENLVNPQLVNYTNQDHFNVLPGTSIIIGSSAHTGDIFIGDQGSVDIQAKNMVAVTSAEVTSIDNVITTGIVAELIVGSFNEEYVTPVLTEVEVIVEQVEDIIDEKKKKKNLLKDDEEEINMCEAG